MAKRDAAICSSEDRKGYFTLNTQELKIELDELVLESGITPYFIPFFPNLILILQENCRCYCR